MSEFLTALQAVVPVFLIAAMGFALRKLDWLTEEADTSLLRVTVNVLIPCLAVDSILGNKALSQPANVVLAPLVGFGTVLLGVFVALAVQRWVPARTPATRRTFVLSVAVYNYGYVPLPLAWMLFDRESGAARETVAVLFAHNVGVEIALWGVGLMLLAGAGIRKSWKHFLNPPLVTIVCAVALNLAFGESAVPTVVRSAAHFLGQSGIPMALLLIGATMADHAHEFARGEGGRVMTLACLLRLGLLPIAFLLLARHLPAAVELKRVMVLEASMPAAVFPIVMARHYGGDPATALRVVLSTSLVGLLTIPLWLRFGMDYVGLLPK